MGCPAVVVSRPTILRRLPYGSVTVVLPFENRAESLASRVGVEPLGVGWLAVATIAVREAVVLPLMSDRTSRRACKPSGRPAVSKVNVPLAERGQGTASVVGAVHPEPAGATATCLTTLPSA